MKKQLFLYNKTIQVIKSCQDFPQLMVAANYVDRAVLYLPRSLSSIIKGTLDRKKYQLLNSK